MTRRTSRREFLGGRQDPSATGDRAEVALPAEPTERAADGSYLLNISRAAMACQFELLFNAGQYVNATQAAVEALDLVDALEAELSFFRPTSHISRLNLVAAEGPVEVDAELFELIELALELHDQTAGAFDITSAPLWEAWGFARRQGALPATEALAGAMSLVGSRNVKLDREHRTIEFTKPAVRLNLGSIGKGYALDRCAEVLAQWEIGDYLFHGGQSSVLARGSRVPADPDAGLASSGWVVGLRHPLRPQQYLAEVILRDNALGTSGSTMQYFRHRGHRYGHILDPRTGQPAEGVISVTVVAPTATMADALSTALFVMGPERAWEYCRIRPELAALFVCPAGKSGRVDVYTMGFGEGELRWLDPSQPVTKIDGGQL